MPPRSARPWRRARPRARRAPAAGRRRTRPARPVGRRETGSGLPHRGGMDPVDSSSPPPDHLRFRNILELFRGGFTTFDPAAIMLAPLPAPEQVANQGRSYAHSPGPDGRSVLSRQRFRVRSERRLRPPENVGRRAARARRAADGPHRAAGAAGGRRHRGRTHRQRSARVLSRLVRADALPVSAVSPLLLAPRSGWPRLTRLSSYRTTGGHMRTVQVQTVGRFSLASA